MGSCNGLTEPNRVLSYLFGPYLSFNAPVVEHGTCVYSDVIQANMGLLGAFYA